MDALSDILSTVSLRFSQVGTLRLSAPGAIGCRGADTAELAATCMCLVQGEPLWLFSRGKELGRITPGDVVFATKDCDVVLGDSATTVATDIRLIFESQGLPKPVPAAEPAAPLSVKWGGGGKESLLLGFAFGVAGGQGNPLVKTLPEVTVIRPEESSVFPWIPQLVSFLTAEEADVKPGFAATARVLAELVFVSLVRAWVLKSTTSERGWMRGLLDPKIARVLAAIHKNPAEHWTVSLLAREAGMSRTAFSIRFTELVGQPPIEYLTFWRMHLARCRLQEGKCNIAELSSELGYASEAVFRQAFKRFSGLSPSGFVACKGGPTTLTVEAAEIPILHSV